MAKRRVYTIEPAHERFRLPAVPRRHTLRKISPEPMPRPQVPPVDDVDFLQQYADWHSQFPGGSILEYIVWVFLTQTKGWENHYQFEYQYPVLGGRTKFGGYVVDFFIPLGQLAWDVNGLRYHLENPVQRAQVQAEAAQLAHRGIKLINLWEDDLIYRSDYTLENALLGEEVKTHSDQVGIYV